MGRCRLRSIHAGQRLLAKSRKNRARKTFGTAHHFARNIFEHAFAGGKKAAYGRYKAHDGRLSCKRRFRSAPSCFHIYRTENVLRPAPQGLGRRNRFGSIRLAPRTKSENTRNRSDYFGTYSAARCDPRRRALGSAAYYAFGKRSCAALY